MLYPHFLNASRIRTELSQELTQFLFNSVLRSMSLHFALYIYAKHPKINPIMMLSLKWSLPFSTTNTKSRKKSRNRQQKLAVPYVQYEYFEILIKDKWKSLEIINLLDNLSC